MSTAVQAVCAVCGPTDLTRIAIPELRERFPLLYEVTEQYLGGPVLERTELARIVSPLSYISSSCPPMLLVHGACDVLVPVEETLIFHEALRRTGGPASLCIIEEGQHGWLVEQTSEKIGLFFTKHL